MQDPILLNNILVDADPW